MEVTYRPLTLKEMERCRRRLRAKSEVLVDSFKPLTARMAGCQNCGRRTNPMWHWSECKIGRGRTGRRQIRWRRFRLCAICCRFLAWRYFLPKGRMHWPPPFSKLKAGGPRGPQKRVLVPGKNRRPGYRWAPERRTSDAPGEG